MGKILLKSVLMQNAGEKPVRKDVLIDGNRFTKISDQVSPEEAGKAEVVDCKNFALLPAFYNGHTHAAMSLLRGYADDMELSKWLNQYIWPLEAKLTAKDIEEGLKANFEFLEKHTGESERVKLAVMPHSVYAVGEANLKRCIGIAEKENYPLHIHLSETASEVENCKAQYGCSPVELLERLGGLSARTHAAHCVHFSEKDMEIFAKSGATAIMNPCSNFKLSSGYPLIAKLMDAGVNLGLGTDGDSSNNNLDMHEDMKLAALLAKVQGGAEKLPAPEALKMATVNVAKINGIDAGVVAEGKLADGILVKLDNERMVPCHDLISNWVYSADSRAIDSVLCDGKFVMRGGHVDGEEDIVREALDCARDLVSR